VITQDQAITITGGTEVTTITANGTGTVTVVGAIDKAVNVAGTSSFAVSGMSTGLVKSTQTAGTLTVTAGAAGLSTNVSSNVDTVIDAAAASASVVISGTGNFTVNGAGTVTMTLTENPSHTTGSLTISNGANALLITESVSGTGAVIINVTAAGSVTVSAMATHASHTVNLAADGAVTFSAASTATNNTINATSTATAHTFINASTIATIDTYIGNSAVDNVTLGLGADRFTTGGGADVFKLSDPETHTGTVSGFGAGLTLPAQATTINVANSDVITVTGTAAAFQINLTYTTTAAVTVDGAAIIVRNSGAAVGVASSNNLIQMVGSYSATTGLFTLSNGGSDTIIVYDDDGDAANSVYRGIVLVGYIDSGAVDTAALDHVGAGTDTLIWTANL